LNNSEILKRKSSIIITSSDFQAGEMIPSKYTCDGENVSPCLMWEGIPTGTASLIIIMEDRDIPMPQIPLFTWVHWIVYNLPPNMNSLPEAVPSSVILEGGALHGMTSYRRFGYSGPRPVSGTHRYYFNLYAADIMLDLQPKDATKKKIFQALEGHLLAKGELMGRYRKPKLT